MNSAISDRMMKANEKKSQKKGKVRSKQMKNYANKITMEQRNNNKKDGKWRVTISC